jgi:hypothetical protein
MTPAEPDKAAIIEALAADRELAHQVLFDHRHPDATPDFHKSIIEDYASAEPRIVVMAFRGGAKSSLLEEFALLEALFQRCHNILLLGNSYQMICDRLRAIKHELEHNEHIIDLFGDQVGPIWNENQIVLTNGVTIQARGARQSLRGTRHLQWRPDLVLGDDLEDEENAATDEARDKIMSWLLASVLPAMDPKGRIRINGTPLDPKSLLEKLRVLPGWRSSIYPAALPASPNPDDWEQPLWPSRFPLDTLRDQYQTFAENGKVNLFMQEMMCRAEDPKTKLFQHRHIVINPSPPAHAPIMAFCDPARTTKLRTSARTGYAVWSWTNNRKLYVHKAVGHFHKPDEIVNELFALNDRFSPVAIGVEPDGLEEFIFQPLRTAQVERGVTLPLASGKAIRAPRDKDGFIGSLQPFFEAGQVELSPDCADLVAELLAFPSGRKDVVNALAYALRMRPGRPIYEDFAPTHIADQPLTPDRKKPAFLALNAQAGMVTAILLQRLDGAIRVMADWVFDGNAGDGLDIIIPDAAIVAGRPVVPWAPAERFDKFDGSGLILAARRKGITIRKGRSPDDTALTPWLRRQIKGFPAFMVSPDATWAINGMLAGYARSLDISGKVSDQPEPNQYCLLLQGLESLISEFDAATQAEDDDNSEINWQYTGDGRRFMSARGSN